MGIHDVPGNKLFFEKGHFCPFFLTPTASHSSPSGCWEILGYHAYYGYLPEMDNLFKEGTLVSAKVAPDRGLLIDRYYKRIYYCKPLNDPAHKLLVYFERELIPPMH